MLEYILLAIIVIAVITIIVWAVRYQMRQNKRLKDLKRTYELELRNGNKQSALQAGRNYYAALRGGQLSIYDEQAIANDLSTM